MRGDCPTTDQIEQGTDRRTERALVAYVQQELSAPAIAIGSIDRKIVDLCARAALSAGLRLADEHFALLCAAAPHLLEMIDRVRGSHERPPAPANVFMFPPAV